ncbi:MAG: thiamine phosphate synthase [bacterium]
MIERMQNVRLYLITDDLRSAGRRTEDVAAGAVRGGAGAVQYRPWKVSDGDFLRTAVRLRAITKEKSALLIINDRCDVALAADADGVHLGAGDFPVETARKLLGPDKIIGFSAHSLEEARAAEADGADYLTLSPLFPTASASRKREPLGIERWLEIASRVSIPAFALGGVSLHNVHTLRAEGIQRVAAVSSLTEADDVALAARLMAAALE